ncbi:MAG: hypothetical protein JWO13_2159 [Acidobacteriales bacterium]|nr:hypothetical protein [Terriglobales bacterium]
MTACAYHAGTPAAAYCRTCGKPLCDNCRRDVRGVVYCEACIAARLEGTAPPATYVAPSGAVVAPPGVPNPTLAAILGIIPGVGAFYNGQYQKGVLHVLMFPALIMLANINDGFGVLFPFYFFYMSWDAYKTAKSRITGEPVPDPLGINNLFGLEEKAPPMTASTDPNVASENIAAKSMPAFGNAPIGAFVLIGLGLLFLLGDINRRLVENFLPILLIGIGLWKGYTRWNVSAQRG